MNQFGSLTQLDETCKAAQTVDNDERFDSSLCDKENKIQGCLTLMDGKGRLLFPCGSWLPDLITNTVFKLLILAFSVRDE